MHIHILGICGTFMAGIAGLARELGHEVCGSDLGVYPPMSEQLAAQGIVVHTGYDPRHLIPAPDCIVVGNALSRGNPVVEYLLDRGLKHTSGPHWLAENVLQQRFVIAVAGTHGKTTTSSMIAWILEQAGLSPGFLIGGVPENFGFSARLGDSALFVVEADEYDTAFFDKRSKFVHYPARTLVLNNLEYDHADIFPDLAAIEQQFHHLVRIIPASGRIIACGCDQSVSSVLARGCWTPLEYFAGPAEGWTAKLTKPDGSQFEVRHAGISVGTVQWDLIGQHNVRNALAAVAAARHAGVPALQACEALASFRNVKRRLEVRARIDGITIYDDFAHHPTAIATTLDALRARVGKERIVAVIEPRSNTMRLGVHRHTLAPALREADLVWVYRPEDIHWDLPSAMGALGARVHVCDRVETIIDEVGTIARPGDHLLIMSNGAFGGIHESLIAAIKAGHV
jgi:UDP-N-acetylmuramate: L-alanyl-gamma-D-glutamyl-meso-diaminopimelate ligase